MQSRFDKLIDSFIESRVGICPQFISDKLAEQLKNNILALANTHKLKDAGTSNNLIVVDKEVRSDKIFWLDKKHQNVFETQFLELIESFIKELNSTCFTGITDYEFHYALYDTGSFYTKHLDQFKNNDGRKYTIILYLNNDWQKDDGGELCIHHQNKNDQIIAPIGGTCVFFQSNEMLHEVLLTHQPRMSITGWLKI